MRNVVPILIAFTGFLMLPAYVESGEQNTVGYITRDTASSSCIGDPRTPLCAVETFLACDMRRQMDLCRMVGVEDLNFSGHALTEEYSMISEKVLRQQDIPEELKDSNWYRPGFVDITLDRRTHYGDGEIWPADGWQRYGYTLKPMGDLWHMASWAMFGYEDFSE